MNIWFSPLPTEGDDKRDADCRTDCDCPGISHACTQSLFPEHALDKQHILTLTLQWTSSLHIQECSPEHWLVCNPVGVGRIAVLDREAMQLLLQFATPTVVAQAMPGIPGLDHHDLTHIMEMFLNAGFLTARGSALSPGWNEMPQLTAWIHMTNDCNLRCSYCYLDKTSEHMASETARKAVDAVFRSAKKHTIRQVKLKYAGGEASLHMRNVIILHDYAVQVAHQNEITLTAVILSNGVVLSQSTIDALKERHINVMISLDGLGRQHDNQRMFSNGQGSSRYVLQTIERLMGNGLAPHLSITVSHRNLAGLPDLMHYILERDLSFSINYYRENACSAHVKDLLFEEHQLITAMKATFRIIEHHLPKRSLLGSLLDKADLSAPHDSTCGIGHNYLVIDQKGGIAKCQVDIKNTITTIAADDPLHDIRNDSKGVQSLAVHQKQGCQTCEWRNWCTGGCPLLTYLSTGRYDVQSPNCRIYKALFPDILHLEALRLLRDGTPFTVTPHSQEIIDVQAHPDKQKRA